jgi:hypothetical protein
MHGARGEHQYSGQPDEGTPNQADLTIEHELDLSGVVAAGVIEGGHGSPTHYHCGP